MKTRPGNYAVRAAESLLHMIKRMGSEPGLEDMRNALIAATPFFLEPRCMELIWNTDLRAPLIGRLPYPRIALEMDFHHEVLVPHQPMHDLAVQRIALVLEAAIGIEEGGNVVATYKTGTQPDSIVLSSLWRLSAQERRGSHELLREVEWIPSLHSIVVPFTALEEKAFGTWCRYPEKFVLGGEKRSPDRPFLVKISRREQFLFDQYNPGMEVVDELRTTLGLLNLLECSNVSTTTIAAPAKLNAKRRKRGKIPIPEYLTLNLSGESRTGSSLTGQSRSHTSPRAHWRRGHIRHQRYGKKLEQTKSIWIQPVVVAAGDEGEFGTPKILVK